MSLRSAAASVFSLTMLLATPAFADEVIYNNLTPNNMMATASRPGVGGAFEIEAADDFVLGASSRITSASFVGLLVPGTGASPSVTDVVVEIYRVFPKDSGPGGGVDTGGNRVPTRVNSPSDVAFASKDSGANELSFTTSVLAGTFTASNSIQAGGIHPFPSQTTGGNGPLTGQEVQFNVTFASPFDLPADHYFFVPQVALSNGWQFYWLSASRPITGVGTTPFAPDLQMWTRDANLDPDWLRGGQDIVGGNPFPTFNEAFALNGVVPEPSTLLLLGAGIAGFGLHLGRRRRATK